MQPIVKWPTENTAFLVIHGNGPHREYQTLDKFARTFYHYYEKLENPEVEEEHKLDDSAQSYVRFKLKSTRYYIDFYEYYWDRHMVRNITEKELKYWLKELDDGINELKTNKFIDKNYGLPLLLAKRDWLRMLANRIVNQIAMLAQQMLRYIKRYIKAGCLNKLDDFISKCRVDLLTDVVIYCLHDQRSSYYEIREKVLSGAVKELTGLLKSGEDYGQIIVVGHSLGSVIAYDALNRIARDMSTPSHSLAVEQVQKIKGLVTFGSFLDVVACFFQEHVSSRNKLEQWIKVERHAFRKPAARYPDNPIDYDKLNNVKWLNFYHPDDVVADRPLFSYQLEEKDQIPCYREGPKWWGFLCKTPIIATFAKSRKAMDAHDSYWENDEMYQKIAGKFF